MKKVLGLLGFAALTLALVWNIGNYGEQTKAGQQEAVMSETIYMRMGRHCCLPKERKAV